MDQSIFVLVDDNYLKNVENITSLLQNFDSTLGVDTEGQNRRYGDSAWVPMELHLAPDIDPTNVQALLDPLGIIVATIREGRTVGVGGIVQPSEGVQIEVIGRLMVSAAAARLAEPNVDQANELLLDRASFRVRRDGKWLRLNPMDFELLEYFHSNPDRVIPRAEFIAALWTHDKHIKERTVDVRVKRLREALGDHGNHGFIRTHRNAGYYFIGTAKE